ncbi:hypothetical protein TWF694_003768 [Orbilia ellipsospora]|uniref:Uncharacterized protein n=1 Tax=Orbilia ellipsospora TaxID=2528407 RepID=A0AAV9X067_9PEZI
MKFTTVFFLAAGAMTVSAQNNTIGGGGGSGTSNSSSPTGTGTPPPIATGGAAHLTALTGAATIAGLVAVMFTF